MDGGEERDGNERGKRGEGLCSYETSFKMPCKHGPKIGDVSLLGGAGSPSGPI